jgi:hypothetical protein
MSLPQRRLWEVIAISPEKWAQDTYGNQGGGFWVVGILGRTVIWYNDIEHGFNQSEYASLGHIGAYWCNQDPLELTIQHLLNSIMIGEHTGYRTGPPQNLP